MVQVCKMYRLDSLSHSDCSGWNSPKNCTCDLFFKEEERQKKQVYVSGVKNLAAAVLILLFVYLRDMISNSASFLRRLLLTLFSSLVNSTVDLAISPGPFH